MKVIKYKRKPITLNAKDYLRNPEKIPPNAKMIIYTIEKIVVESDMESAKANKDILTSINKQLITLNAKIDTIDTRLTKVEKELVETRQEINKRLDYIVKANKLKDLPNK